MAIELEPEVKALMLKRLKSYFSDEFDLDIGDLRAEQALAFMLGLVGNGAYNQGVADAQSWIATRVADVSAEVYEIVDWGV